MLLWDYDHTGIFKYIRQFNTEIEYFGHLLDDKPHGTGFIWYWNSTNLNSYIYKGNFKNGQPHNIGVLMHYCLDPNISTTIENNTNTVSTTIENNTNTVSTTIENNTNTVSTTIENNTNTVSTTIENNTNTVLNWVQQNLNI